MDLPGFGLERRISRACPTSRKQFRAPISQESRSRHPVGAVQSLGSCKNEAVGAQISDLSHP